MPRNNPNRDICCIDSCKRNRLDNKDARFFRFPKNVLGEIWREKCNMPLERCRVKMKICDKHFDIDDIGLARLKAGAVPKHHLNNSGNASEGKEEPNNVPENQKRKWACDNCESHLKSAATYKRKYVNTLTENAKLYKKLCILDKTTGILNEPDPESKRCAICKVDDVKLLPVPKRSKTRQRWSDSCRVKLKDVAMVCEYHFSLSDFKNYDEYKLLPCALPTSRLRRQRRSPTNAPSPDSSYPKFEISMKLSSPEPEDALKSSCLKLEALSKSSSPEPKTSKKSPCPKLQVSKRSSWEPTSSKKSLCPKPEFHKKSSSPEPESTKINVAHIDTGCQTTLKEDIKTKTAAVDKFRSMQKDVNTLKTSIEGILTGDQMKKLLGQDKEFRWTDDDISNAVSLFTASPQAYKYFNEKNIPLPHYATVEKWSRPSKAKKVSNLEFLNQSEDLPLLEFIKEEEEFVSYNNNDRD